MRNIIASALLYAAIGAASINTASAAIGKWKTYMAYHDVQQVVAVGNDIFVRASNSLFAYNTNDMSVTTYDKINGLSDTYITHIAWNKAAKRLAVIYDNSNIDLLEPAGNITNLPDLFQKAMTEDKTVNNIRVNGNDVFLATGFGIVRVDAAKAVISESYILGMNISDVAVKDGSIFAINADGRVYTAQMADNLQDKNIWKETTEYDPQIFNRSDNDYNNHIDEINKLSPGGPQYNYFGRLTFHNGRLYGMNGNTGMENTATIQVYDGNNWTAFENNLEEKLGHRFINIFNIAINPKDESHVFAASQVGLIEYKDGKFVKEYSCHNSPLKTAYTVTYGANPTDKTLHEYVFVNDAMFDSSGNLWITNGISPSTSFLKFGAGGQWTSLHSSDMTVKGYKDLVYSMENMERMMTDSRGLMWMGNNSWRTPALLQYNTASQDGSTPKVYKNFYNQDGKALELSHVTDMEEDHDGNLWITTNKGPLYIDAYDIADGQAQYTFQQYKVPRNDGTNNADYLMDGVDISAMAIDGANRKWFATFSNGVYLISADNNTQVYHFTAENSSLLSNAVLDIAINNKTGEVFFGTDKGLCSYTSDATEAAEEMDKDNVYAYPNPVTPDYTGLITVQGLSLNADVKITTATGYLVYEGRSNGGTFTWNGNDRYGNRVNSGVYNVITAKADGSKGTVCKIAIVR